MKFSIVMPIIRFSYLLQHKTIKQTTTHDNIQRFLDLGGQLYKNL